MLLLTNQIYVTLQWTITFCLFYLIWKLIFFLFCFCLFVEKKQNQTWLVWNRLASKSETPDSASCLLALEACTTTPSLSLPPKTVLPFISLTCISFKTNFGISVKYLTYLIRKTNVYFYIEVRWEKNKSIDGIWSNKSFKVYIMTKNWEARKWGTIKFVVWNLLFRTQQL